MDQYATSQSISSGTALAGLLLSAVLNAHCGGALVSPPDQDGGGRDAQYEGDSAGVGAALVLTGGSTFVGYWLFDRAKRTFSRPPGCLRFGSREELGNKRLVVPGFWLQRTPVTNRRYAACVQAGACTPPEHDIGEPNSLPWDDPARAELPVHGRFDQAEAFCGWSKGRLPSLAELVRAAQGDAELPGVKALTEAAIDCFGSSAPGTSAVCEQLRQMNYAQDPPAQLYPVDTVAADHGASGHADVFGSVYQWTRTFSTDIPGDLFCGLADGSPDFVSFPQDPASIPHHFLVNFATAIIQAALIRDRALPVLSAPDHTDRYYYGMRCAFDSAPN